jgi:hypothetical protein
MILIIPVAALLLLAVIGGMYYRPLRIWYREARQLHVLTEQKAAINEYNEELKASLLSLETTEGIRAYAREELGLVEEGDNTVVVIKGGKRLERGANTRQTEILNIPSQSQPYGVWTPFLDVFFQIEIPQDHR